MVYEKPLVFDEVFLMNRLFKMNKLKGRSIALHLNEFNILTSYLSYVRVNFDDEVMDIIILCWLLESWNSLVMDVRNFVPGSNTFKFDDIVGVIIARKCEEKE